MLLPLISTVSISSLHASPRLDSTDAVETIAPLTASGMPPEYRRKGSASERNGTAPAETSNSLTTEPRPTICRTFPMVEMARAARCMSQNQSYRAAWAPSSQTARPAMKNGLERKSCVSEKTSSQVPSQSGESVGSGVGLSASRSATSERADFRSLSDAASPRQEPAARASRSAMSAARRSSSPESPTKVAPGFSTSATVAASASMTAGSSENALALSVVAAILSVRLTSSMQRSSAARLGCRW
mmetsp:Transcript_9857/g.31250  ORF Transcript_9857/g.31250 Transcript_9857/m.31250 type:complete len:244 (-) Transcript_9857:82-813(-)